MAQITTAGSLPCLFCGKSFRNSQSLTRHLDVSHQHWVKYTMDWFGLLTPAEYPVDEYRRALAEALAEQKVAPPLN